MSYSIRGFKVSLFKIINLVHCNFTYKNLIYIKDNDLIIDIPKSGSSFIKSNIIFNKKSFLSIGPNYPHAAIFKRPMIAISELNKTNLYAFVKDPIERFCSVFREKILNHSFLKTKWNPKSFAINIQKSKFDKMDHLVDFLIKSNYKDIDKHTIK